MKNNLLIYSLIIIVIFIFVKTTLNFYDLDFMYSIYCLFYFIIYITAIIGIIQLTNGNKLALVGVLIIIGIVSFYMFFAFALASKNVKIYTIENQKVVEEKYGIPDQIAHYYKYINLFLKSYTEIEVEEKIYNERNITKNIQMPVHND